MSPVNSLLLLLPFCGVLVATTSSYSGPYLFWGVPKLNELDNSALNGLDEEVLKDIYAEASAIMIFVKNSSHQITTQHYPSLENLLADRKSAYMTQSFLINDPMDISMHTEVIALSGTAEQEDIELCALFRDAEINFGENKVLGILANADSSSRVRQRREANELETNTSSSSNETSTTATPESTATATDDHIYKLAGKALFYTSEPPVLKFGGDRKYVLERHLPLTVDDRESYMRLGLKYVLGSNNKIVLAFRIEISGGYWTLVNVEVTDNSRSITLPVVGKNPSAPLTPLFSYTCSGPLVFANENVTLTMQSIQLQPKLPGDIKFEPAVDCVGFMSAPILSGLFVTSICLIILGISLTAILDIKTPNRFENSRSKQLTFAVQE